MPRIVQTMEVPENGGLGMEFWRSGGLFGACVPVWSFAPSYEIDGLGDEGVAGTE